MIFGKIDYLNLLPFHIFMKQFAPSLRHHAILNYKKGVPSHINKLFKKRKVDSAFISSIVSPKKNCCQIGIVAKKEVQSVLVIPGKERIDTDSQTSNQLAKVLNIKGQIIIGDKALRYALKYNDGIDLAQKWHEKYHLPFVFARLCFNTKYKRIKKLSFQFLKKPYKIPYYILNEASKKSNIDKKDILIYLKKITYKIGQKEEKSLKLFLKKSKIRNK